MWGSLRSPNYSKLHSLCPLDLQVNLPKKKMPLQSTASHMQLTSVSVEQVPPSHAKIRLVVNYLFILICQSPIISQVSLTREVQRHNEVQQLQHVQVSGYKFINYRDLNLTISTFHHFSEFQTCFNPTYPLDQGYNLHYGVLIINIVI